jgi:hypothetical protein
MFIDMEKVEKIELRLSSCPHCGDNINIICRSIIDNKNVINQFYKYFNWHLLHECFDRNLRVKKKIKLNIKREKGKLTIYDSVNLIV